MMVRLYLLTICLMSWCSLAAQEQLQILHKTLPVALASLSIDAAHGQVQIYEADGRSFFRVDVLYMPEIEDVARVLHSQISIDEVHQTDSIFLSTKFDEKLNEKTILDLGANFTIVYSVYVEPTTKVSIKQRRGEVYTKQIQNHVVVDLDQSFMSAKYTKNLVVTGRDFQLSVARLPFVDVSGERGEINFTGCQDVRLDLNQGTVNAIGFNQLKATVREVEFSAGRSNVVQLSAEKSRIEFTNISEEGILAFTDCKFVLQRVPPKLSLKTTGGNTKLSLANDRNAFVHWESIQTDNEIWARNGSIKMAFKQKKTNFEIPDSGHLTKKSLEFMQSAKHGMQVEGIFKGGRVVVKK